MVPTTMPSPEEAVSTTKDELENQLDYYKSHKNQQLFIGNLIDASYKLSGQLLVINLILFGKCKTYSDIAKELGKSGVEISSSEIGHYAKADVVPSSEMLVALHNLSKDKTRTLVKARRVRTPSKAYRESKQ